MDFEEPGDRPLNVCGRCQRQKVGGICRHCQASLPRGFEPGPGADPFRDDRDRRHLAGKIRWELMPVLEVWLDPADDHHLVAKEKIAWAKHARDSLRAGAIPQHPAVYMREDIAERFIEQAARRGVPQWVFDYMRRTGSAV